MSFSIESIRNLNKIHLLAMGIKQKENRIASTTAWQRTPTSPWRVSMYGGASVGIGGAIQYENTLQGIVDSITNQRIVKLAMSVANRGFGIAPNIDIPRKYLYSGVENLSFNVRGMLVLENDLVEDYFVPIEKLAYLAFPDRGIPLNVGEQIKKLSDKLQKWLKDNYNIEYSFTNSVGAAYNMIAAALGKEGVSATDSGEKGFEGIKQFLTDITGTGYSMTVPPTFNYLQAGSGLDFRYGGILISDVFIKSLKFDIPKLYYQGGYPAVINVDMMLETMRPITATAITKILMTQTQAWEDGGGMAEDKYKMALLGSTGGVAPPQAPDKLPK